MATFFDDTAGSVLDALLQAIIDGASAGQVLLISTYTQGQDYATVTGNSLGNAAITSSDFTAISGGASNSRVMSFSGKTGSASATDAAPADLHIAITNGTNKVLCVTDETSDQAITSGNTLNFPSFQIHSLQPTQVP